MNAKKSLLTASAKLIRNFAGASENILCWWSLYEPKCPELLKEKQKEKKR